ncbi:hypothetical protein MRS44_017548 [Fusarium solani]|uniref:uncharacterized protein n=1 Tax=Fusarium solani TaxID=169388 RepID=UPI0032C433E1|nr:hypothetical protein MRS44_017548 [Fusarium solani]
MSRAPPDRGNPGKNHAKIEKDALDHNDWNELRDIHAFLQSIPPDLAPVYVAGILLHPALRKSYLSEQWKRNPAWVSNAVKAVRKIWSTEYKSYQLPDKQQEKGQELDEFDRWRQKVYSTASEVKDEFDRFIYWWLEPTQRENFPLLCRMAIDIFCIPHVYGSRANLLRRKTAGYMG